MDKDRFQKITKAVNALVEGANEYSPQRCRWHDFISTCWLAGIERKEVTATTTDYNQQTEIYQIYSELESEEYELYKDFPDEI